MYLDEIKNGSFRELLDSFLSFLRNEKFYSDGTIINYRRTLCNIDVYMCSNGFDTYTPMVGDAYYQEYMDNRNPASSRCKAVRTMITRLNAFASGQPYVLQQKYAAKVFLSEDYENAVQSYLDACRENGNKAITIHAKKSCLYSFLERCISYGGETIAKISPDIVTKSCLAVSNKDDWCIIRAFLVHLCQKGYTDTDFSTLVPHFHRPVPIPAVYSPDEIRRVENVPDRTTAVGKRDYAMLLLATRLGIRSGDIVRLTFKDIDTSRGIIQFAQEKTGEQIVLPLIQEVSDALEDYIHHSRPASPESRIFLRSCAPYIPITTSVIRFAVTKYFKKAGVDTTGKKHGPHVFRSSLASSMVNDGHSYESIRAILGHTDPDAVKHYAKLDIERLRTCALPVPPPSGSFLRFLKGCSCNGI